jgi:hypothetical protein
MAVGTDATHPATNQLIGLAAALLGSRPLFFGRYFKGPHNPSPIQYQGNQENPVLSANNIRVLCIARQTTRVGGSAADGVADAVNNMAAVVDAFGAAYLAGLNFEPLIFLDTELSSSQPTLSADYYSGWAGALREQGPIAPGVRLQFTPGVYINRSDNASWRALGTAMGKGAPCYGAWVANYGKRTGAEPPPAWDPAEVIPKPPLKPPASILAWQYAGDYEDVLDFSITPATADADAMIALMIAPPGS